VGSERLSGVLLGTHAVVWLMEGITTLGSRSRALAHEARSRDELLVSAVSFWELAMLYERGRVALPRPVGTWRRQVLDYGVIEVPFSGSTGILAAELDGLPRDPADRMIAATVFETGATLVTADDTILNWTATLSRHDART
jgi:PIN domain nuclease of toxin-antitoxin system